MSHFKFDDVFVSDDDDSDAGGRTRSRRSGSVWSRGIVLALCHLLLAAGLLLHAQIPNTGGLGSLVETFLPWLGALAVVLLLIGLARRSATATIAFLVPVAAWGWVFWPQLSATPEARSDLVVVQHNVADTNRDVAGTARILLAASPDVVTLDEVTPELAELYTRAFGDRLPHHATRGTVGVWSTSPLGDVEPVNLHPSGTDTDQDRGMKATVEPGEDIPGVTVYAVHLPSTQIGTSGFETGPRDESIHLLAQALTAETSDTVIVAGDLNTVPGDRSLDPVTSLVAEPRHGFGFTYPAAFPLVRIDHVLARGAEVTMVETLDRTGSDHLPIVAHIDLPWS